MSEPSPPQANNPYIVGRPVERETLYGRDDVFRFVYDTLASSRQNAVVLYGQRRSGKTSILRELPHRLPPEKFRFTFFDLQGQAKLDLADVLFNLAGAIAETLQLTPPNKQDFQADKDYFRKNFLPIVWQKLAGRRLLLLFDEFEVPSESANKEIKDKAEQEFYPYMRDLLDKEKRLSFVFVVGRRIDDLAHWVKRVFKEAQYKKIGLLQKSEAIDLITRPADTLLNYNPEAIEAILNLTSGHPFFTQLICFELFNYAQKHNIKTIVASDVAAIVSPALESGKPAFTWLWDAISTSGQIYLAAIAHLHAENQKANKDAIQAALDKFRIRRGADWSSAPRELTDWDILRDNSSDDLQFVVRLMELWVRESHGLREMKATLTQEGEGDFKKARALAQNGQPEQAVKALRDLLTMNPNHLGAQLALARLLLDQKKIKEAVDAFEDAFWLDEDVGRDGLVDARLAMAQALEENQHYVEAALHYRRVLELKRDEYRVQEKLRVLYDQGRKAAAAGDWTRAAHFLERVTDIDKQYKDAHHRRDSAYHRAKTASQPLEPVVSAAPPSTSTTLRALMPVLGSIAVLLLLLGGAGGWFILNGLVLATPTATQAIALVSETPPTASPTPSSTPEPTQTPMPASTDTPPPTETPASPPTDTPTPTPTDTPTPTPTDTPTPTPTKTPLPSPTATPQPTQTPIIIQVVVTATPTATPSPLPTLPPPQLLSPPDLNLQTGAGVFNGRANQPRLEWSPVPNLGQNDFYTVSVSFPSAKGEGGMFFGGVTTKATFWDVPQSFYDDVSGAQRDFTWSIVISRFQEVKPNAQGGVDPVGEGQEVSQRSQERTFRWN